MTSTTIRIDSETRDRLRSRGRMGESFDDVIRRLLEGTRALDREAERPFPTLRKDSTEARDRLWRPLEGRD